MIYNKNTFEFLSLLEITSKNNNNFFELKTTDVTFVWNRGCTMKIFVNQVSYQLLKNDIIIIILNKAKKFMLYKNIKKKLICCMMLTKTNLIVN